jgi:hypothetical protein
MNSQEKAADQVLGMSEKVIRDFLMECVNLPDPLATIVPSRTTPYATWSDACPPFDRWVKKWQRLFTFQSEGENGEIPREQLRLFVPKLRIALCRIWIEPDARQRDWYFYRLRSAYQQMIMRVENPGLLDITDEQRVNQLAETSRARGDNSEQKARFFETSTGADLLEYVPRLCPLEAALYWLQNNQRLMLHCGGPMCAAPYFFRTEKGQKFCSGECADPARREAKLRWWNESPNSPKNQRQKRAPERKKKARKSLL